MGLGAGELAVLAVLLVILAAVYWVIRLAVRHGRQDAAQHGTPE
jgi:hypothetical protein